MADRLIYLTQDMVARVDAEDWLWLCRHSWHFGGEEQPYARRTKKQSGVSKTTFMHREIMRAPPGMVVNHRDGDTLNNTRRNLNVCTVRENGTIYKVKRGRFGAIGVDLRGGVREAVEGRKDYRTRIVFKGVQRFVGHYGTLEEATRAYDYASVKLFGIYAPTNYPKEDYLCPFIEPLPSLPELTEDIPF